MRRGMKKKEFTLEQIIGKLREEDFSSARGPRLGKRAENSASRI
jgi:hypothetical protein